MKPLVYLRRLTTLVAMSSLLFIAGICSNPKDEDPSPGGNDEGKASVTINGKTYKGEAVCDINYGGMGKAYGILINDTEMLLLYNLKQGSNSLTDVINGNSDIYKVPWAAYFDGSDFYFSTSGSATLNGRVVSGSAKVENDGGDRKTISASGNCL